MTWVIAGLFYGLFMSFYTYINQNNKVNGYVLGIWRGLGVAFVCFPLILITPFEWDLPFFLLLIIQGLLVGFYDSRLFFSSAKFGAAGLIMAILGGSILPPLQASIIDCKELFGMPAVNVSFVLPLICFVVIVIYGNSVKRAK